MDRECEIILLNEYGKPWKLFLRNHKTHGGGVYIRTGWRRFCRQNRKRVNSLLTFKLVQAGTKPVLQLCSSMYNRDSLRGSSSSSSSSRSQERFLTLTLTTYSLRKSKLVRLSSVMSAYCSRGDLMFFESLFVVSTGEICVVEWYRERKEDNSCGQIWC